jgi:hypothetical protein
MKRKFFIVFRVVFIIVALVSCTSTPDIPTQIPAELSIEEHPLVKRPEIEPLIILPQEALTQAEILDKHSSEWEKTLPPNEYYSVGGGNLWVSQGNDKLETSWETTENEKTTAQVTRNRKVIFSTVIEAPGTTSPLRVLTVYDDHWVIEIAQAKAIPVIHHELDSFFIGEIFVDGQSLNTLNGYEETFGFQTIHDRPFYFYKRNGKTGISYDGREIPLNYNGIPHYGCCSASALNPRIAQDMIGFFAWRGNQWFYTEIHLFKTAR